MAPPLRHSNGAHTHSNRSSICSTFSEIKLSITTCDKASAHLPERAHVVRVLMPSVRLLAGEGFRQQDPARIIGHGHEFDIEAIRVEPALLQMIPRCFQILGPLSGLGGKEPDDDFHGALQSLSNMEGSPGWSDMAMLPAGVGPHPIDRVG